MNDTKIIAYYLPQFHPFDENDLWWGKGFTEWTNVGKAKSLYRGHYQPKVPADLGYYDLRLPKVRIQQVELAREAGITGFCYWHYWFGNGKQLLNEIIDEVVATSEPNFPFCLGWANETWKAKQWNKDGKGDQILMLQEYGGEEDYRAHFLYVLNIVKDTRYILVDDKPIFLVYKPFLHPEMELFIKQWNRWIKEEGFRNGFYFIARATKESEIDTLKMMGFDAVTMERTDRILLSEPNLIRFLRYRFAELSGIPKHFAYRKAFKYFHNRKFDSREDVVPSLIPNWDHSPRSGKNAFVLDESKPEYFKESAKQILSCVVKKKNKLVFLKSWNEWAEGNYMEPDLKYGKGYINALREAINDVV